MKTLIYFLLFLSSLNLFISCGDGCTDEKTEFLWEPNKTIVTRLDSIDITNDSLASFIDYNIINGMDNVFEVRFTGEFCEDVLDGFGGWRFALAVPSDSTDTFSYSGIELREAFAFYESFGGLICCAGHIAEEGQVVGTRIDEDSWRVSIDIVTTPQIGLFEPEPIDIIIDEIFSVD